jgi:hypothetical protein
VFLVIAGLIALAARRLPAATGTEPQRAR